MNILVYVKFADFIYGKISCRKWKKQCGGFLYLKNLANFEALKQDNFIKNKLLISEEHNVKKFEMLINFRYYYDKIYIKICINFTVLPL